MRFLNKLILSAGIIATSCMRSEFVPELEVPQSLGIQTKTNTCSTKDLELIRELGIHFIRRGFYWYQIEKEKDVYDFTEYDRLVHDADANGLRILGCLYGSNTLYENDNLGGIQTEEGRKGFANFSAALAKHFKGHGIIWEIWNEPNIGSFWRRGEHNTEAFAEEYTALVNEVVPAMHTANPECFVITGAVSALWEPSLKWMNFCLEKGIHKSGINGWSLHPYSYKTPEEHADGYAKVRSLFEGYGIPRNFPLFNSERGFTIDTLRKEGWSGGLKDKAAEYMAWHFVRQYMVDLMNNINLTIYYEWIGKEFGVFWEGEKRAAYYACNNMVRQLKGYRFKNRIDTGSPLDYILLFESKSGNRKLVVWTAPPAQTNPEQTLIHTVNIPVKVKSKPSGCDIYGKQFDVIIINDNISITITGAPQYISLDL